MRTCVACPAPIVRRPDESWTRFAVRQYCGRKCSSTANAMLGHERRRAERIEDLEWIAGTDTTESVARRLGYASVGSLIRTVARWDRPDLIRTLLQHTFTDWTAA